MPDISKRPGTITFVAIVLFVFGTLAVFSSAGNAIYAVVMILNPHGEGAEKIRPDDAMANVRFLAGEIPGFVPTVIGIAAVDVLFAIAQIFFGVGLLRLRPAARTATINLILARLVYSLCYDAYSAFVMIPAQIRFFELHPPELPREAADFPFVAIMKGFTLGAFGCNVFLQLFIAGLIVFLLRSAAVRDAFAGVSASPAEPGPLETSQSPYSGYDDESTGIRPGDTL